MADSKYAIKPTDGPREIHAKHLWLIRDQQAANRKLREAAHKKAGKPEESSRTEGDKEQPPTQAPASDEPQNPEAPQNQPVMG
jgi:hypothetical protein